jgi:hypothetical protein
LTKSITIIFQEVSSRCELLQEEKSELQRALAEASSLFETCAQTMLTELANGQAPTGQLDTSLASEALQQALSRVQDNGVEVLCLSEVVSKRPDTANAATQTVRTAFSDAALLTELRKQLEKTQTDAAVREKTLQERRE